MIPDTLADFVVPIGSVRRYPGNPRTHNLDVLRASLRRNGQYRPIVVNRRTMQVLAGNGTHEAAELEGWTEIAATMVDVTPEEAARIVVVDNRASDLGGYDDGALLALLDGLPDLEGTGYDQDALAALQALADQAAGAPALTDPDAIPEPPAEPISRPGDLWLLGPHRLLCGDATKPEDVARIMAGERGDCMWTDPPYGVEIVGGSHALTPAERLARGGKTLDNDEAAGLPRLLRDSFATTTSALQPGAAVYLAHPAGAQGLLFSQAFVEAGWRLHQILVWVKDQMVLGHADYHYRHEPILYGYTAGEGRRGRGGHGWYGDHTQTSVFEVPRPKRSEDHPTMKPVELVARGLANSCPPHGLAYDPFAGSGSTIVAAHSVDRRCYALEIAPQYVDVACRRYQEHTGVKPILERTGEPHDFTA